MDNRQELICKHISFANDLAGIKKKKVGKRIDLDELKSAAYLGLVDAASRYKSEEEASFKTFAYSRINGEINEYIGWVLGIEKPLVTETFDKRDLFRMDSGQILSKIVKVLPERGRNVIQWYYGDKKPKSEIAKLLGVTEGTVSIYLFRYKKMLRNKWAGRRGELFDEMKPIYAV